MPTVADSRASTGGDSGPTRPGQVVSAVHCWPQIPVRLRGRQCPTPLKASPAAPVGPGRCAVDGGRLRAFMERALLLLVTLTVLAAVATAWGLSVRAAVLLALVLLVPGLLWLALRP